MTTNVLKQLTMLRNEVNRLRRYDRSDDYLSAIRDIDAHTIAFDVRYLGDWEVPADEEDDGDYDWKVPTTATRVMLDALVKRFSVAGVTIRWFNQGEKCWLSFTAEEAK